MFKFYFIFLRDLFCELDAMLRALVQRVTCLFLILLSEHSHPDDRF